MTVAGAEVKFVKSVKLLGVVLDETMSLDEHTSQTVCACNYHLRALRHVRPVLTTDSAKAVGAAIVHVL